MIRFPFSFLHHSIMILTWSYTCISLLATLIHYALAADKQPFDPNLINTNFDRPESNANFWSQFLVDEEVQASHQYHQTASSEDSRQRAERLEALARHSARKDPQRYSLLRQYYSPLDDASTAQEPIAHDSIETLPPSSSSQHRSNTEVQLQDLERFLYETPDVVDTGTDSASLSDLQTMSQDDTSTEPSQEVFMGWSSRGKAPAPWKYFLHGDLVKIYKAYIEEFPLTIPNAMKHLDHVADANLARQLLDPDPAIRREAAELIHAQCDGIGKPLKPKPNKKATVRTKAKEILNIHLDDVISAVMAALEKDHQTAYRYIVKAYNHIEELSQIECSPETMGRIIELILYDVRFNKRRPGRPQKLMGIFDNPQ